LKKNLLLNNLAIFIISALAGSFLFYKKTDFAHFLKMKQDQEQILEIHLPQYIKVSLNETTHLSEVTPIGINKSSVLNQLKIHNANITDLISPIYKSSQSEYAYTFYVDNKKNSYFALLKKYQGHDQFQIIASYKTTVVENEHIQLAYGEITGLSHEQYFFENLKLAQTQELEENL